MFFGFDGLGGNISRQSLLKDVQILSFTPEPTSHMLLGLVGPLMVCCYPGLFHVITPIIYLVHSQTVLC